MQHSLNPGKHTQVREYSTASVPCKQTQLRECSTASVPGKQTQVRECSTASVPLLLQPEWGPAFWALGELPWQVARLVA
eukprot:1156100-Pelagomonas_calceolata.AAC.11